MTCRERSVQHAPCEIKMLSQKHYNRKTVNVNDTWSLLWKYKCEEFYKIKRLYLLFVLKPLSALLQFNLVSVKSNLIKLFSINFHQLRLQGRSQDFSWGAA